MAPRRAFQVEGEWWLPGREGRRVTGTLRFDPEFGAELRLIGAFRGILDGGELTERRGTITVTHSRESIERDGTYPRILGVAGGKPYTLEDCVQTQAVRHLMNGGAAEAINVRQIYQGAHFEGDEPPSGNAVSVDLRYLTHWVGRPAIGESYISASATMSNAESVTLQAEPLDDEIVRLKSGARLRLTHSVRVSGDQITRRSLAQRFYFRIDTSDVEPSSDLIQRISDLQDLVSIAAGRTAEIDGLRLWHPDVAVRADDHVYPQPVQFFVQWNNRDTSQTPGSMRLNDLYFTYEQFGGIDGVGRWLDGVEPYRSALGRVVASRYAKSMFTSDRFLNCAAALESFDKAKNKSGNFRDRMQRCTDLAGEPFQDLVHDIDAWIQVVKGHRNDIAHGTQVKQTSSAQFFLARSLYWLFVLCLLREVQAPDAVFDRIQKHPDFLFLGPRVQAAAQIG
ncbi:HEPN domain-containing protein [Microtetraspora malaysiensis]|uniref:ApeA N-terminal domain 1-containing protein n=1 Tax=Microtetraspora malaysiensis TaxID=161358 RepID=UPI0008306B31|nr:HEPN domain-containing protein [Microtetraspora malaysiensis]